MNQNLNRIYFLDHLRAFLFILLAFDHCIHAYALNFGKYHFIQDLDRNLLCDAFYLFDNSVIMPLLFFICGLFVLPSLQSKGWKVYLKDRFYKLGLPYFFGIPFIVPLLVFPRYSLDIDPTISYWNFWKNVYFVEKLQGGGPFWVLFCLALYSAIILFIHSIAPNLFAALGRGFNKFLKKPMIFSLGFILFSMIILGLSDFKWGAPWWIGLDFQLASTSFTAEIFNKIVGLFRLQGSRFILHGLYFVCGAVLSASNLWRTEVLWQKTSDYWRLFLWSMLVCAVVYIGYILSYIDDGTYSPKIYRLIRTNASLYEIQDAIMIYGPKILWRTSLHAIFVYIQSLCLLTIFYRFFKHSTSFWQQLAPCCYGIFLIHEVPVIWLQGVLVDYNLPWFLKVTLCCGVGILGSWIVVSFLRRFYVVRKILG